MLFVDQDYLDQLANRTKEKRYTFDFAYDTKVLIPSVELGRYMTYGINCSACEVYELHFELASLAVNCNLVTSFDHQSLQ